MTHDVPIITSMDNTLPKLYHILSPEVQALFALYNVIYTATPANHDQWITSRNGTTFWVSAWWSMPNWLAAMKW